MAAFGLLFRLAFALSRRILQVGIDTVMERLLTEEGRNSLDVVRQTRRRTVGACAIKGQVGLEGVLE
jgi:hypothetical protein